MKELLELSFSYQNLIPTILFFFSLIYWLTVILGAIDIDTLDIDVDLEIDMEADADVDVDIDSNSISWLNHVLAFFNLGKIPFMIWLTFVAMPLWLTSIITNELFGNKSFLFGLIIMIPLLIGSMLIGKIVTIPLIPIFKALDDGDANIEIVGKRCKIVLPPNDGKIGQAEIEEGSSFLLIYIYTENSLSLKKGEMALVIQKHKEKDYYLVEPYQDPS